MMVKQKHPLWQGFHDCILIAVAGMLAGLVIGVLAHLKTLTFFHSVIMSTLVFGGVAQMLSLSNVHAGSLPLMVSVVTTFIVCLRFSLMGITLRPHFQGAPRWKTYLCLLLLTDENWALTLLQQRKKIYSSQELLAYFLGAGLAFYAAFVLGTMMGYGVGYWIHDPKVIGFDFAIIALFLSLLVGFWRGKEDVFPWILTGVISIIAQKYIHGEWYIVIGALLGSLIGFRNEVS